MAATHLSLCTATGSDKVTYPMLKHLVHSGMDFFFTSLIFPGFHIPFFYLEEIFYRSHPLLVSPASFWLISLTSCVSTQFECIIRSRLLFFLEYNAIFSHRQAGFHPGRSTLIQILFFSQPILDGFHKPKLGSQTILATIDFKVLTLSSIPLFSTNLFQFASLLALLAGLNLSF